MRRVFLDATCWVAAAGRPQGGSAKILMLAREGRLVIVTTQFVLQEAERNIWEAFGAEAMERFYRDVADLELEIIAAPIPDEEARWQSVTAAKDCHVLAAVYEVQRNTQWGEGDTAIPVSPSPRLECPGPVIRYAFIAQRKWV